MNHNADLEFDKVHASNHMFGIRCMRYIDM